MSQNRSISVSPVFFYHTLYWIINVLFFTLVFWTGNDTRKFMQDLHVNIAYLPAGMIFTYFSVNYLIPRFFFSERIAIYITLQLLVLLLYPVISNLVNAYYISPVILGVRPQYSFYNGFLNIQLILLFDIVPLAGVKILNKFRHDALGRQKTEYEKTEAELKLREAELELLKAQIQPHFLFNTLNNIYSLSLEKSDKTSDLIIKLADMLSYIIYDCNSERVPLSKEIDFINNFIELQRVRYHNCTISIEVKGNQERLRIAPMILYTFIENAFKHGADKDPNEPWIRILVATNDGSLYFESSNSIREEDIKTGRESGIGIANVEKRLALIYPARHEFVIRNTGVSYNVLLKIELDRNEQSKDKMPGYR